jgi:hypothetical protein
MTWDQARHAALVGGQVGLKAAADYLLQESILLAPFETDRLIGSARAGLIAGSVAAYVAYDTEYAVIQHENLSERHDPGRQGKYLEGPLVAQQSQMRDLIARGIRKAIA